MIYLYLLFGSVVDVEHREKQLFDAFVFFDEAQAKKR